MRGASVNEQIERSSFTWSINPLIAGARHAIQVTLNEQMSDEPQEEAINELDIVLQSMLSLCLYRADEAWSGDEHTLRMLAPSLPNDFTGEKCRSIQAQLDSGLLKPDLDLIRGIAGAHRARQRAKQEPLLRGEGALANFIRGKLSKFDHPTPETTTKAREYRTEDDGTQSMLVRERNTGRRILVKRVDLPTSRLYARELHYVHKAREDEVVAFGAYLEEYDYPFAWVSYSPIGTEMERQFAQYAGAEPERILEMTRAWNTMWSPKNTMSILFSYAHSQLQQISKRQLVPGVPADIGGIITAINPNLGFSGMAFSGVDFGVVGLKPTNHKFLIQDGVPIYMLRRDIAQQLGVPISKLEQSELYGESSMPLLPTNVMMVIFNKSARHKPSTPIYIAS